MILLRMLLILSVLMFLPTAYLIHAYFREGGRRRWRTWLWGLNILVLAYLVVFILYFPFNSANGNTIGITLLPVYALAIGESVFATICFVGRLVSHRSNIRRQFLMVAAFATVASLGTIVYGYVWGRTALAVVAYTYESARIPHTFDGYRIVQITDLHLSSFYDNQLFVEHLVDSINALSPDVIFVTGDVVSFSSEELTRFVPTLSRLEAKDGVFSIMGNHDYGTYTADFDSMQCVADTRKLQNIQRDMGWKLLLNEHAMIHRGDDVIVVEGTENATKQKHLEFANLPRTIAGVDSSNFQILLTHGPNYWKSHVLPNTSADLTLSGHLHGFQYLLFGVSPAIIFSPQWSGAYHADGDRVLYVSRGIGTSAIFPVRFGAWPEINVITLKRK